MRKPLRVFVTELLADSVGLAIAATQKVREGAPSHRAGLSLTVSARDL